MIRGFLHSKGTKWAFGWAVAGAAYAALTCSLLPDLPYDDAAPATEAALALGMGLVLGLRINRAYDRWWEARTLWGNLVNASRNLSVKLRSFGRPDAEEAGRCAREIAGFAYALRDHLREGASVEKLPGFEDRAERPEHVPSWIVGRLYDRIQRWHRDERISDEEMRALDLEGRELLGVCGACERIRNTPMPPSLPAIARITMALMLGALPWTLEPVLGWLSVPAMFLATFFVTLGESTAVVIEHPFGTDPNELDLTRLCRAIETTTAEILMG